MNFAKDMKEIGKNGKRKIEKTYKIRKRPQGTKSA
jgi:hypothetical protein